MSKKLILVLEQVYSYIKKTSSNERNEEVKYVASLNGLKNLNSELNFKENKKNLLNKSFHHL